LQWLFHFDVVFNTAFYQYDFGFSADTFNSLSHFMGNPLVQFVIQPILIVGVIFHFIMGFVLDFKIRPIKYIKNNGAASSPWASRNMIVSGSVVLAFWHCIFTILGSRNGL
jgi:hypothetical protein